MSLYTLTAALLLQAVKADFSGDVAAVSSNAEALADKVNKWSSADGLAGALGIQGDFPNLESAVNALSKDAGSLSANDVKPDEINSFVGAVSKLLSSLAEKASDFSSVGAGSIVKNDLSSVSGPSAGIVSDIVKAISGDCDKITSLTSALGEISQAFSKANDAYSADQISFAQAPSCNGGSGSSAAATSAAETSAAATSGAATSAAETSAASKPTAAGNGTGNATVTNTVVNTATEDCGCTEGAPTPSASAKPSGSAPPTIVNGASLASAGAGAVVVAAVGLLL